MKFTNDILWQKDTPKRNYILVEYRLNKYKNIVNKNTDMKKKKIQI